MTIAAVHHAACHRRRRRASALPLSGVEHVHVTEKVVADLPGVSVSVGVYVSVCALCFIAYGSAAANKDADTITTVMNNTGCKVAVSISLIVHIFFIP